MSPRRVLALLLLAATAGCLDTPTRPQRQPPIVPVTVELSHPGTAAPGEEILFTVRAYNNTDVPVRITDYCGPPLDVVIYTPGGGQYTRLSPPDFWCAPSPEQYIPARSSVTAEFTWRTPSTPGTYSAVAGGRSAGLLYPSRASLIDVR